MCLKRYSVLPNGKAIRLSTYVDIPTEIGLPHFIQDDQMNDEGPLYGNFKLSLQAVVCHRGDSVDSGHYISLVRGTSPSAYTSQSSSSQSTEETFVESSNHWMRFDDLATERITLVDIEQALKEESPYLLFYQILPIGDADDNTAPSSAHSEHTKVAEFDVVSRGRVLSPLEINGGTTKDGDEKIKSSTPRLGISVPGTSQAIDLAATQSLAYSDTTVNEDIHPIRTGAFSKPTTPKDEDGRSSFSFSRRMAKVSKGSSQIRTDNQTNNNSRKSSLNISRATSRMGREKPANTEANTEGDNEDGNGNNRQFEKGEKTKSLRRRDKSKGKEKQRQKNSTLKRSDKPDRECAVM